MVAYCDADLAGDRTDSKSTSGVLICLVGPRTYMPITGVSKKQTSVSKSTPEAEIVALDHGVSKEGMALATLWQRPSRSLSTCWRITKRPAESL